MTAFLAQLVDSSTEHNLGLYRTREEAEARCRLAHDTYLARPETEDDRERTVVAIGEAAYNTSFGTSQYNNTRIVTFINGRPTASDEITTNP